MAIHDISLPFLSIREPIMPKKAKRNVIMITLNTNHLYLKLINYI
jgi:hypothetical protein